jgi:hypothetical protein
MELMMFKDSKMKEISPRDFCIWLSGFLDNNAQPEYLCDFVEPIKSKLNLVNTDIGTKNPLDYPLVSPMPVYRGFWSCDSEKSS